jgi:hypothetical protein
LLITLKDLTNRRPNLNHNPYMYIQLWTKFGIMFFPHMKFAKFGHTGNGVIITTWSRLLRPSADFLCVCSLVLGWFSSCKNAKTLSFS